MIDEKFYLIEGLPIPEFEGWDSYVVCNELKNTESAINWIVECFYGDFLLENYKRDHENKYCTLYYIEGERKSILGRFWFDQCTEMFLAQRVCGGQLKDFKL